LFSFDTPVSSTNKTYRHEITEILLKVALNTITHAVFSTEAEELGQERKGKNIRKSWIFSMEANKIIVKLSNGIRVHDT
jgi:hypothetical protein